MDLFRGFTTLAAPETGRRVVQLTNLPGFNYPLYYFIPTMTKDQRYLVFHHAHEQEVQLYRLDLHTGEQVQITNAKAPNTLWYPWCVDKGSGVLDHRSVLNQERREVVYFDDCDVRCVGLDSLTDRLLFRLPESRMAIGQNCVTPNGQWLVYIHHDRDTFVNEMMTAPHGHSRCLSRGTVLAAYNFETQEHRELVRINSPIHHVLPWDDEHVVFCHPTAENGMLWTNLEGGWYTHLRTQDAYGGCVCHYLATERGLIYEVLGSSKGVSAGLYHPFSHKRYEFPLPEYFGYTHTGWDPQGRLWFFENQQRGHKRSSQTRETDGVHDIHFLQAHKPQGADTWLKLMGDWPTYGGGQSSHFHPQVTPDRKWILFTAGDPENKGSNQLFLLDIADLSATEGIPEVIKP